MPTLFTRGRFPLPIAIKEHLGQANAGHGEICPNLYYLGLCRTLFCDMKHLTKVLTFFLSLFLFLFFGMTYDSVGNHGIYKTVEGLTIAYVAGAGNANKNVHECIKYCQRMQTPIDILLSFDWPAVIDALSITPTEDKTISWSSSLIDLINLIVKRLFF